MKNDFSKRYYDGNKIPKPTFWTFTSAALFRDACYTLVSTFLMTYMTYGGLLSQDPTEYTNQLHVITILRIVFLLWDGINDPIFGIILEKCHLKTGKFRPWILIGGVLNAIVVALLFTLQPKGWAFVVFWAIMYFLWDSVFTLNDIGYWSMVPSLTSDEKARNRLTTYVSLFVSIGVLLMYGLCSLLPSATNYSYIYGYIAVPTCILFALSQIAIFFVCKEKRRDPKQELISSKSSIKDLFIVFKKNKPLRTCVIALLLYYTGSTILTGIGTTYFYMLYGFGGNKGGTIYLVFAVFYGLGSLLSQVVFGIISKKSKIKQKKLALMTLILSALCILTFYILTTPFSGKPLANPNNSKESFAFAFSGTVYLAYIPVFFFFLFSGIFYLVLLIWMQNSIEYNEYKFGERKESIIFAWRPLTVKLADAIKTGLLQITLITSGIIGVTNQISQVEQMQSQYISNGNKGDSNKACQTSYNGQTCTQVIDDAIAKIPNNDLIIMSSIVCFSIILCYVICYLLITFSYKMTEEEYSNIVKELEIRNKEDILESKEKIEVSNIDIVYSNKLKEKLTSHL